MTNQMSEMQHEVDDKLKAEQALKAAEQARNEVGVSRCCGKPFTLTRTLAISMSTECDGDAACSCCKCNFPCHACTLFIDLDLCPVLA